MERRTQEEWLKVYEDYKASEMTPKMWCKEVGIKVSTFNDRLSRMRKLGIIPRIKVKEVSGQGKTKDNEVKWVSVEKNKSKEETITYNCEEIKVTLGEYVVHIPHDFQKNTLIEVFKVLKEI